MIKIGEVEVNNSISKNVFRIIYIFTILIIVSTLYISLKGPISVFILKNSSMIEATVTRNLYTPQTTEQSQTSYRVEFKYVVNSKEYIVHEDLGDKITRYDVGQKIKIYYDNNNVNKAQIYRIAYLPLIFVLVLLPLSTLIFIKSEKRKITSG